MTTNQNKITDESWSSEEQIRVLMNVKEALLRADTQAKDINLLVDRAECVLAFLNEQEVTISGLEDALASGKTSWYERYPTLTHPLSISRHTFLRSSSVDLLTRTTVYLAYSIDLFDTPSVNPPDPPTLSLSSIYLSRFIGTVLYANQTKS